MSDIHKTYEWPVTVYYEDTDAGGVVYHSNYLKFFERARTELLRSHGINQQQLLSENIGFVVRSMEIDFLQGAKLDEDLVVRTQIIQTKKASFIFCQKIVNLDSKTLCSATVKVACTNRATMKPIAIPSSIILELTNSDR